MNVSWLPLIILCAEIILFALSIRHSYNNELFDSYMKYYLPTYLMYAIGIVTYFLKLSCSLTTVSLTSSQTT